MQYPDLAKTWVNAARLPSMMSNEDSNVLNQYLQKVARSHECKLKYVPNMCSCREPEDPVLEAPIDLERPCNSGSIAWCRHPMGRAFLKRMITHYANLMDFQSAAMLCCVFAQRLPEFKEVDDEDEFDSEPPELPIAERPMRPIHHRRAASEHGGLLDDEIYFSKGFDEEASEAISASVQPESVIRALANRGKRSRCNSETPSLQDELSMRFSNWCFRTASESEKSQPQLQRPQSLNIVAAISETLLDPVAEKSKISPVMYLDPEDGELHGALRRAYADMLAKWQLFKSSTEVLKTLDTNQDEDLPDPDHELVFDLGKNCQFCWATLNGGICRNCKSNNDHCSVCELKVRGLSSHCLVCGHGGHLKHLRAWFESEELCPTGCGCKCAKAMSDFFVK